MIQAGTEWTILRPDGKAGSHIVVLEFVPFEHDDGRKMIDSNYKIRDEVRARYVHNSLAKSDDDQPIRDYVDFRVSWLIANAQQLDERAAAFARSFRAQQVERNAKARGLIR